jgi:CBS domain-containing protein
MTTVRQLINQKSGEIWSVAPDAPLAEALDMMYDHDIGVVVVVDQGKVAGIFSERDFARRTAVSKDLPLEEVVSDLMTSPVVYVTPDDSMDACMALMTEKHIRHLPVLENGRLVGMISIGDVVRDIVSQKDITIRSLENYILGREHT